MEPLSVSRLNSGSLISNKKNLLQALFIIIIIYYFFFSKLAYNGQTALSENVLWRNKVSVVDSHWFYSIEQEHFDVCLLHERFHQHLREPPMQIAVLPWRHWLYSNSQLLLPLPMLLLLLPGNIQYFIVQLCSGAEQKSAFHLISSRRTSIWVRWYVCVCMFVSLKCIAADHFVEYLGRFFVCLFVCLFVFLCNCWVWFFAAPKCNAAMSLSKHLRVAPFQIILPFWKIEAKKKKMGVLCVRK